MKKYILEAPFEHNKKLVDTLVSAGTGILKNIEIIDALITNLYENGDEATFILTNGKEITLEEIKKLRGYGTDPRKFI